MAVKVKESHLTKNMKKNLKKYLEELLELREIFAQYGQVGNLQATNYEIAAVAKKLGIRYLSLE